MKFMENPVFLNNFWKNSIADLTVIYPWCEYTKLLRYQAYQLRDTCKSIEINYKIV